MILRLLSLGSGKGAQILDGFFLALVLGLCGFLNTSCTLPFLSKPKIINEVKEPCNTSPLNNKVRLCELKRAPTMKFDQSHLILHEPITDYGGCPSSPLVFDVHWRTLFITRNRGMVACNLSTAMSTVTTIQISNLIQKVVYNGYTGITDTQTASIAK